MSSDSVLDNFSVVVWSMITPATLATGDYTSKSDWPNAVCGWSFDRPKATEPNEQIDWARCEPNRRRGAEGA